MWKSIVYKEWLKIRKVSILSFAVGVLFVIGIYLTVRHDLIISDAESFWNSIVNRRYIFFTVFEYVPLIMGLAITVAQFVPEVIDKRIKLTLHLPLNEETVVLRMVGFGLAVTLGIFAVLFMMFYGAGLYYFPSEIVRMAGLTIAPWFLAGVAAYLLGAFVILEPVWKYRILYILFSASFLHLFFKSSLAGAYGPVLPLLVILVGMCSISTLFSIYRFRKGEM